jgi:hypothetical protein
LRPAQSIADEHRARQESDASALEVQGSENVAYLLQTIEKPNRSATDQLSMMAEDEIKYLQQFSEPTRSSEFLREFFEEAADGELVQAEIAEAHKMFFDDENFLSAINFIRYIPKAFKGASTGIAKEPKPRYVVRGIRARSDRPDLVQQAADWLREQTERDAGDPLELDEVKPAEENRQAELVPGGLPSDWLQETEATEPVEEPAPTSPTGPVSSPQPAQPIWQHLERDDGDLGFCRRCTRGKEGEGGSEEARGI